MIAYYGYTISPNQMETVEGFLICRNVPIARTGTMEYLESELKPDGSSAKMVTVYRDAEEVFAEAALSSFEGKPVTDEHPPELLTPETYSIYAKGHAQNIRRGTGEWSECVVADLHIQDKELIQAVQDGKREISCGYECSYTENEDGTYAQHEIRGNHIAVVTRGRAGKHVAILDSKSVAEKPERNERMKKNSLFFKLFARAAKDASPEELENLATDVAAVMDEEPGTGEPPVASKEDPPKEDTKDAAGLAGLDSKLDMILELMGKKAEAPAEPAKDPLDALVDSLTGESESSTVDSKETDPVSDEGSKVIPAEGSQDDAACTADRAVMAAVVKQLRPVIAGIKDDATRKSVTDSLVAALTDKKTVSDIQKIAQVTKKNAEKATDQKPQLDLDACQSAYDAMNPHRQKNGGTK